MADTFKLPDPDKEGIAVEDDSFEIEIEDDTPVEDRRRVPDPEGPPSDPTDDELSSYDEKVQARIKKFTRGYHDERRAKEAAEREREAAEAYARQILEDNKRLQQQLATGSQVLIETSKSAAESNLIAAKRAYKEAIENGDIDAQTEAQAEIARATLKMERAQGMRPIEEKEWAPPPSAAQQTPAPTRRTQRWLENNKDWWGVDEEMTMTAMGLDKKLQREYGSDYIGSEEYFQTIDKTLRKRFPEHFGDQSHEDDDTPPKKRTSEPVDEDYEPPRRAQKITTVVAPATRSTPPNRVKLKGSEAAIARRLGVPIEEYAKQVAKLRRG